MDGTRQPRAASPLRRLTVAAVGLVATIALVAGVVGCGGDDEEDVQAIIDEAFSQPVESADVTLNADLELEGGETEPFRLQLSGPYVSGGDERLPSFDFSVALQGGGAQVPPLGLVSTGDNVFVEIAGASYELGEELVAAQTSQLEQQAGDEPPGLAALGVDPRDWIEGGELEEGEDVAGVPTEHVSASVDVAALLADLNDAAQSTPNLGGAAPTLSEEEMNEIAAAIEEPRFDVFVGEDDGQLRRLTAALDFEVPGGEAAALGGAEAGTLSFSVELANVGGDQQIDAPQNARPISELLEQLGGLGALLGGGLPAPGGGPPVPGGGAPTPGGGSAAPSP